jgi:hypothetical protein
VLDARALSRQLGIACSNQTLQGLDVIRERITRAHGNDGITDAGLVSLRSRTDSQCRVQPAACGLARPLRQTPIDPFEQISELPTIPEL